MIEQQLDQIWWELQRVGLLVYEAKKAYDVERVKLEAGAKSPVNKLPKLHPLLKTETLTKSFEKWQQELTPKEPPVPEELKKLLNKSVAEIELSVRASHCLDYANIRTVGQLAMRTEKEMLKYRNIGRVTLNEIKRKLGQLGLSLGMKLEPELVVEPPMDDERLVIV